MIETLNGIQETVHFNNNVPFKLYSNQDFENYPAHWHMPLEIIMPLNHTYPVTCNQTLYELREGDILFIAPGVLHSMPAAEGKRLILQIDFSFLHALHDIQFVLSLLSPTLLVTPDNAGIIHPRLQLIMSEIERESLNSILLSEAAIYARLIEMLVLVGRNMSSQFEEENPQLTASREYTRRFLPVIDYINEHYAENLTLEDAAELSGFSKYYFARLFKQLTHDTFYQYLTKKRIDNAARMLQDDSLSITEIALNCGFGSISAFIRMFKILKHCTPTEFKTMHDL